jgi:hypothetical protein
LLKGLEVIFTRGYAIGNEAEAKEGEFFASDLTIAQVDFQVALLDEQPLQQVQVLVMGSRVHDDLIQVNE